MNELISIVIPAYEVAPWIAKCLDSIRKQTYQNLEVIVIDDGSADGTGKLCEEIAQWDTRISVIRQSNQGVSAARNRGLSLAHGKYICFVDGDDFLNPGYIQTLYSSMQIPDVQMAVCGFQEDEENGQIRRVLKPSPDVLDADKLLSMIFFHDEIGRSLWNKMLVRKIIADNKILFSGKYLVGEDMLFLIRYLQKAHHISISNTIGYHYLWRKGSAMQKQKWDACYYRSRRSWIEALKSAEKLLHKQKEALNQLHFYQILVYYRILCESASLTGNSKKKSNMEHLLHSYVRKYGLQTILSGNLEFHTAAGMFLCWISPRLQVSLAKAGRHKHD